MTEAELEKISTTMSDLWPATDAATGTRAIEAMAPYAFNTAIDAMDKVRSDMPDYHRVVEPNKLAAACRAIEPNVTPRSGAYHAERTARYLAHQNESKASAVAAMSRVEQEAERAAAARADALAWCLANYQNCWASFAEPAKEKLVKIRLAQMASEVGR